MSKPIQVMEVRPYVSKAGKQMFSFNQGAIHLSLAQLAAAGVQNPFLLQRKTIFVDFFEKGEKLLNGQEVTEGGRIVKTFTPELDMEVEREVGIRMREKQLNSFTSMMVRGTASGNIATGSGQDDTFADNPNIDNRPGNPGNINSSASASGNAANLSTNMPRTEEYATQSSVKPLTDTLDGGDGAQNVGLNQSGVGGTNNTQVSGQSSTEPNIQPQNTDRG